MGGLDREAMRQAFAMDRKKLAELGLAASKLVAIDAAAVRCYNAARGLKDNDSFRPLMLQIIQPYLRAMLLDCAILARAAEVYSRSPIDPPMPSSVDLQTFKEIGLFLVGVVHAIEFIRMNQRIESEHGPMRSRLDELLPRMKDFSNKMELVVHSRV